MTQTGAQNCTAPPDIAYCVAVGDAGISVLNTVFAETVKPEERASFAKPLLFEVCAFPCSFLSEINSFEVSFNAISVFLLEPAY